MHASGRRKVEEEHPPTAQSNSKVVRAVTQRTGDLSSQASSQLGRSASHFPAKGTMTRCSASYSAFLLTLYYKASEGKISWDKKKTTKQREGGSVKVDPGSPGF